MARQSSGAALANAIESSPSSLSAFRFVTFVGELTVKGGFPTATLSPSAVAPRLELPFWIWSALSAILALSVDLGRR